MFSYPTVKCIYHLYNVYLINIYTQQYLRVIKMSSHFDIIIIGGGVNGASIAMALSQRSGANIGLFDRGGLGSGATGRSGAMIREHYLNSELVRMASDAKKFFEDWQANRDYDLKFRKTGRVLLFDQSDADAAIKNAEMNKSEGVNIEVLDKKTTSELLGEVCLDDIEVILYEPDAGYADSLRTTYAFAKEAQKNGTIIHNHTSVERILTKSDRVCGIDTSVGKFEAEKIINVSGPWINKLLSPLGESLPVTPIRVQMVGLRRPPHMEHLEQIVVDHTSGAYFRTDGTPFTLVGGESEEDLREIVDPDSFGLNADHDFITRYWSRAINRFPSFKDATCRGGYGSLYDMTPDSNPILDKSSKIEDLYNVTGFSGHGFKLSPVIGEMVADMVMGTNHSRHDNNVFKESRFANGSGITPKYPYLKRAHQ